MSEESSPLVFLTLGNRIVYELYLNNNVSINVSTDNSDKKKSHLKASITFKDSKSNDTRNRTLNLLDERKNSQLIQLDTGLFLFIKTKDEIIMDKKFKKIVFRLSGKRYVGNAKGYKVGTLMKAIARYELGSGTDKYIDQETYDKFVILAKNKLAGKDDDQVNAVENYEILLEKYKSRITKTREKNAQHKIMRAKVSSEKKNEKNDKDQPIEKVVRSKKNDDSVTEDNQSSSRKKKKNKSDSKKENIDSIPGKDSINNVSEKIESKKNTKFV